jgi:ArsR family transcriptional regulator
MVNMKSQSNTTAISNLFQTLGVPPRLEILLAIGNGESCVCHLEAVLGYRQAYISQHLMALREAKLLDSRRDGRFIYYRLADEQILEVLAMVGQLLDQPVNLLPPQPPSCECPNCVSPAAPLSAFVQLVEAAAPEDDHA